MHLLTLFCVPWIVGSVHVLEFHRPPAEEHDRRFLRGVGEMIHPGRRQHVAADAKGLVGGIEKTVAVDRPFPRPTRLTPSPWSLVPR
jgi:hypothetical protein